MSVRGDYRWVSKEGLQGCQYGEIAGMSVRRDCMDVSQEGLQVGQLGGIFRKFSLVKSLKLSGYSI